MNENYILGAASILLGVISALLKGSINDLKSTIKELKVDVGELEDNLVITNTELGKANGRLALVESQTKSETASLKDLTTQQFKSMGDQLTRLENIVTHSDNQARANTQLFTTLLEELTKKKS
jgi:predicted nuclease with TOPRIM domain